MPAVDGLFPNKIQSPMPHSPPDSQLAIGIQEEVSHFQDMLICTVHCSICFMNSKFERAYMNSTILPHWQRISCWPVVRESCVLSIRLKLYKLWTDSRMNLGEMITSLRPNFVGGFCQNPEAAGLNTTEAKRLYDDLQIRYTRLCNIRARYRAFIIDEAQDNSAQQWRLLGRLWGPRNLPEGHTVPNTPWQPTVCCVGDRKQSIYAFRQAQVSGFVDFGNALRDINTHEFHSEPALTRKPEYVVRTQQETQDTAPMAICNCNRFA